MSAEWVSVVELVLMGLFAILVMGALACQVLAMRHKTPDALKYMHKDSLFKNKELVYTETGMRYIRAQKLLAVGIMLVCIAFLALYGNQPAG